MLLRPLDRKLHCNESRISSEANGYTISVLYKFAIEASGGCSRMQPSQTPDRQELMPASSEHTPVAISDVLSFAALQFN